MCDRCDAPDALWLYTLRSVLRSVSTCCSMGSVDIAADIEARVLAVACTHRGRGFRASDVRRCSAAANLQMQQYLLGQLNDAGQVLVLHFSAFDGLGHYAHASVTPYHTRCSLQHHRTACVLAVVHEAHAGACKRLLHSSLPAKRGRHTRARASTTAANLRSGLLQVAAAAAAAR